MPKPSPRYLVNFHPKSNAHCFTDVLIIGGGLAGLQAAIAIDPSLQVVVITKDALAQSNSSYAQGGIAGVFDPLDDFDSHFEDTLIAGGTLCEEEVVRMVVQEGPSRIRELVELGTRFDKTDGQLQLGKEGGHSHHRIVHALGDSTGKEVMRAVMEAVEKRPNISIWHNTFTIDLLTQSCPQPSHPPSAIQEGAEEECVGAIVADQQQRRFLFWAKQTILCTGGAGRLYRESTNPDVATADGHALALRAGVEVRDMEFMQFHPTVLYIAGSSRSLITEAVRGEGAYLVDRHGDRFMEDYDARAELAPRDIVSQAIVTQMEKTQHPSVYLDMSHLDSRFIAERFPGILSVCRKFGLDITHDRIPVRPGAHYMIGGVSVDLDGRTSMPGLWAAGEVTSSGLHGANRLASNSLLEGLVYGAHAGAGASAAALRQTDEFAVRAVDFPSRKEQEPAFDPRDVRNALTSLMWRCAGVRREQAKLVEAAAMIDTWRGYVESCVFQSPEGWELQNMLEVSRVIVDAAMQRTESRGVHLRVDHHATDDGQWLRHINFRRERSYLSPIR